MFENKVRGVLNSLNFQVFFMNIRQLSVKIKKTEFENVKHVLNKNKLIEVDFLSVNLYKNQTFTLFTVVFFFFIDNKTEETLEIK